MNDNTGEVWVTTLDYRNNFLVKYYQVIRSDETALTLRELDIELKDTGGFYREVLPKRDCFISEELTAKRQGEGWAEINPELHVKIWDKERGAIYYI